MCMASGSVPSVGSQATTGIGGAQGATSLGNGSGGGGGAMSGAGGSTLSRPASRGTVLTGGAGPTTGPTERAPRNIGQVQRKLGGGSVL